MKSLEISLDLEPEKLAENDAVSKLEIICNGFHRAANGLLKRRKGKAPFKIDDEYDVQDLIEGQLKTSFEDVRPEEWTPSYAGSSSRIDYILPLDSIAFEIKKTRPTLKDKEIGEELLIDIAKYKKHPDCNKLVCFVYDPDCFIQNPEPLKNDLESESSDNLRVIVFIRP
ncbi:hypothetical protein J7L01_01075 [bacterium]|nr:hypothetical protein [bacterium]